MSENKGLYQTLAAEVKKTVPTGVIIPAHKNYDAWHAAYYNERIYQTMLVPETNMAHVMLGHIGIPFKASFDFDEDEVYDQKDSEGFINLFGLPLTVKALMDKKNGENK